MVNPLMALTFIPTHILYAFRALTPFVCQILWSVIKVSQYNKTEIPQVTVWQEMNKANQSCTSNDKVITLSTALIMILAQRKQKKEKNVKGKNPHMYTRRRSHSHTQGSSCGHEKPFP